MFLHNHSVKCLSVEALKWNNDLSSPARGDKDFADWALEARTLTGTDQYELHWPWPAPSRPLTNVQQSSLSCRRVYSNVIHKVVSIVGGEYAWFQGGREEEVATGRRRGMC